MKKRIYIYRDVEFILEPLSESVVRVNYQDQKGYVGLKRDWEADRPYTWINWEGDINDEGISAGFSYSYPIPELALEDLCSLLLREQRKQDAQRINPEERKKAARHVFREFLEEMPEAPVDAASPDLPESQESASVPAALPEDGRSDSLSQLKERSKEMAARSQRLRERAEALNDPGTNMFEKARALKEMASGDVESRKSQMRRLNISEEELLPFLTECLTHHYDDIRTAAARVLTHLGDDTVLFHFVDALEDRDFHVRYDANRAILVFEDSRPLVRHIQSYIRESGEDRRSARIDSIEALEELGDERAVPFLIGALYDPERNVRTAAAAALGTLGSERAVPTLLDLLERDWSRRVVFAAGRALGRIGGDRSFEGLTERLSYLEPEAWMSAAAALGEIGDERAIAHIVETLPDKPYGAMREAARALEQLDDGDLVTELLSDLESAEGRKRECAALALGLLGDSRALDSLALALKDSDGYVAAAAARALGWLGDGRAFQPLADALSHRDYEVRGAAFHSLDRLGDRRAIEVLERFIEDKENEWLRRQVGQSLRRLRESE